MATAADIVRDALKELGVLAAGESLKSEDLADGIRALNRMLGSWANERLLVFGTRRTTHTLVPSASPQTIGASGGIVATRPLRIDGAGVIPSGQSSETPLHILTDAQYQSISDKTVTADVPQRLWVEPTYPNANLWLWPVPTTAATLVLQVWGQISAFAASDVVSLPDGYEDALILSLAMRLAPSYGVAARGTDMEANANEAVASIKRTNTPEVLVEIDPALLGGGGFNINTGE